MHNENLSRNEAADRSAIITVRSYDVSLDLRTAEDPQNAGFPSRTVLTFDCSTPGATTFLDFIHGGVEAVTVNGANLDPAAVVEGARITLPDLAASNTVVIQATALYSRSGEGMHRFEDPADGATYLYTQYEPADARRVFACFEQPDLKASFTFHVRAPEPWTVASNGAETERDVHDDGSATWHFAPTQRISTYITTVLAGPYATVTDQWTGITGDGEMLTIPLELYCRRSLAEHLDAARIFDTTRRGLTYFHDLFAYPYPFGKYGQAFVPEYNLGAMENPGLVTFSESYVFRSRATHAQYEARDNTIMHEMAHMWFGDLVTMTWWDDLWLKESFADFMGALAVAEALDSATSWVTFATRRKAWAYLQDQLPSTHPIVADIVDLEAAKLNFDGITYAKGASVLKQLVAYAGFEAFASAARAYFREHAFSNTTLEDLLRALSAASGRDMSEWAGRWLLTSGVPQLAAEVATDDDGAYTSIAIHQSAVDPVTGTPALRPHQVQLGLYSLDVNGRLLRTGSESVLLDGERTEVPALQGHSQPDLLLINDDDLTYAKLVFDERSLATLLSFPDRLEEPLARAVCLAALWSSTRDALLSAEDYLAAVERSAPSEDGVATLQQLLQNAHHATEHYTPAGSREVVRERFTDFLVRGLEDAQPGSDQQLVWARALAASARKTPRHAPLLRALLEDERRLDGLEVDDELGWQFRQALAAQNLATVDELEAALQRDHTAAGRTGFTTACTAVPDAGVKEKAWHEVVFGNRLSNELLSATIAGFREGPRALREPYVSTYFEQIDRIWREQPIEMSSRIIRGLYPGDRDHEPGLAPEDHPVLAATDRWLHEQADAPQSLRRIVLEERDHLLRALRAQAAAQR
ncbi:aminopeptidase N [Arthrobacter sp. JZ12]|uniref:aminopeptidase N n=1 Tax=Arthrobacter sp. JZ12 TaxID=2654190 RepID=UPI002B4914E8|nr:aminopeptidase N [Arthrobacter sp. JZ12]WRH24931.1 aminopeptidase N [Arthrobacter sp. JZ12]